jgi:tetratricopeptide (TPR) repeat protein
MRKALAVFLVILAVGEVRAASLPRTILVLPFENKSARSDLNWISESFAETLMTRLSGSGRFVLGRGERDSAYNQLGIPAGIPLTLASAYRVAETLGVDWVVTGDFSVESSTLRSHAQVLEVQRLKRSAPLEVNGPLDELIDLQTRLAWRLLASQDPDFTVGSEEDFQRLFPVVRLDAYENYIRGVLATEPDHREFFWREGDRLNPSDHRAALELGRLFYEQKDYENSARWLRKLEARDTNYLEALFLLGVNEFFLGHDAAAEKAFLDLSRQIPLNEVWNNLGFMQARGGRLQEAIASFGRAYEGDPTDPVFCFNLGVCLWQAKKFTDAVRFLQEAVQLAPDDPEFHRLLGEALGATGDSAGKQRELQWTATQEDNSANGLNAAILPNLRLKKNYDGRAYRQLALAVHQAREARLQGEPAPRHAEAHMVRGRKLLATGRARDAQHEFAEAVSLLSLDHETHLALAQAYEVQGLHRKAAAELEASLRLKPTAQAHLILARVCVLLNRPEAASDHGRAALNLDPTNAEAQTLIHQIPSTSSSTGAKP